MPETTSPDNIRFPVEGDDFSAFFNDLEDMAGGTQAAITRWREALQKADADQHKEALDKAAAAQERADFATLTPTGRTSVASAGVALSQASWASVALDTVQWTSPDVRLSSTTAPTSRLYAARSGIHVVEAAAVFGVPSGGAAVAGERRAQVRVNAAGAVGSGQVISNGPAPTVAPAAGRPTLIEFPQLVWYLARGEYVELFVYQSQGSTLEVVGGPTNTHMSLTWLCPRP